MSPGVKANLSSSPCSPDVTLFHSSGAVCVRPHSGFMRVSKGREIWMMVSKNLKSYKKSGNWDEFMLKSHNDRLESMNLKVYSILITT